MESTYYYDSAATAAIGIGMIVYLIFVLILTVVSIVSMWIIFSKAGEAGWKAIIPFYNVYILFKLTWGNGLFFLLLLIPFVNLVILIITYYKLAKAFGKGIGFTIGLLFLSVIFLLILAFGSSQYQGVQ